MAQRTETQVIDRNGFSVINDGLQVSEGALSAISAYEAKSLDGAFYVASLYSNMGIAGVQDFRLLSTLARKIKFNLRGQSERVRMQIYQAPTINPNGVVMTAAPPTFGANLSTNFVWSGPTVGAIGTLRFDGLAITVASYLYTIPALTEFLVRFTNISGATNQMGFNICTFI